MGGPKKTLALQYAKQCRCQLWASASATFKSLYDNSFMSERLSGGAVEVATLPIYCAVQRKQRHHPAPAA
jgi:hypothetical protein